MMVRSVVLVPHTHWDREWYEPFAVFREQLVEMLDGLLEIMEAEPRYRHFHLDGQSALIDDYLAVRPERESELIELIRTGRLSIGPWFTQMDEFLVSGESIDPRSRVGLGQGALDGRGGADRRSVGRLPPGSVRPHRADAPAPPVEPVSSEPWSCGACRPPSTVATFVWRSPDGSEVLAEYLMHGYYLGADLVDHLDDAQDLADELVRGGCDRRQHR